MLRHRHSGPLRKLSSRQPRHAFRAHSLISLADRILLQQRDIVVKCHDITGALIFNLFVFM